MQSALVFTDISSSEHVKLKHVVLKYFRKVDIVERNMNSSQIEKLLAEQNPDLVFFDESYLGLCGIEFFDKHWNGQTSVVIISSKDQNNLVRNRRYIFDYLLKPLSEESLNEMLRRYQAEGSSDKSINAESYFHNKMFAFDGIKLAIPVEGGFDFVPVTEIVRLEASSNYTFIYLKGGNRIIASRTLLEFEKQLSNFKFLRVHHSHLVNLSMLKGYRKGEGGKLILTDGSQIEVSRNRRRFLLQQLKDYSIIV